MEFLAPCDVALTRVLFLGVNSSSVPPTEVDFRDSGVGRSAGAAGNKDDPCVGPVLDLHRSFCLAFVSAFGGMEFLLMRLADRLKGA